MRIGTGFAPRRLDSVFECWGSSTPACDAQQQGITAWELKGCFLTLQGRQLACPQPSPPATASSCTTTPQRAPTAHSSPAPTRQPVAASCLALQVCALIWHPYHACSVTCPAQRITSSSKAPDDISGWQGPHHPPPARLLVRLAPLLATPAQAALSLRPAATPQL